MLSSAPLLTSATLPVVAAIEIVPLASAHPLGGAVLGKACDLEGRVKRYPGLYVVDGAFLEGNAVLTNRAFTIAALAERRMDNILRRDRLNNRT